jgi:hypothetical protein
MGAVAERTFSVPAMGTTPGPAVAAAIVEGGDLIRSAWLEEAADHNNGGDYVQRLQAPEALGYPYLGDPWAVGVVNDAREADWLEEGRAGFHLPQRWGAGGGVWKVGESGGLYAHVPFRHFTPARAGGGSTPGRRRMAMPTAVASLAAALEDGARLSMGALSAALEGGRTPLRMRPNTPIGADLYTQAKSYDYYRQLPWGADVPDYLGHGYSWRASPYEGLTHRKHETPGGGHQSEYVTFRTITPESEGWFIPPSPAYHLAAHALDRAAPQIERLLDAAAAADLAHAIVNATGGLFE